MHLISIVLRLFTALFADGSDEGVALPVWFVDVTEASGLDFRHEFGAEHLENILMTTGAGCALFDFDRDGWLDAFLVNGTHLDEKGAASRHGLFRNRGDGTFENVTAASGITATTYGQGCALGDFDADGFTDLYITNYGPNLLYRNRGDGTFEEVGAEAGVADPRWSTGAAFFDADGDGDLDLYVAHYVRFQPDMKAVRSSAASRNSGFATFPGPRDYAAEDDRFYRNNGDGSFAEVSDEVGLVPGGKGLTVAAGDLDLDGDQDLFVANDTTANFLYQNDGGRFVEVALEAGVAYDLDGNETGAMGVDLADLNDDGRPEISVTNMLMENNNLFLNQGELQFLDEAAPLGLAQRSFLSVGWATCFQDFDHDGRLDGFFTNGHVVEYSSGLSDKITFPQRNLLFLGTPDGQFRDIADSQGSGLEVPRVSRGAAFGDIDNDGDLDLLVQNAGDRARLYRNELPVNRRWLKVRLRGRAPNTDALGAQVVLKIGGRAIQREVRYAPTYLSSSGPDLHFGLASEADSLTLEITWPSGLHSSHEVRPGASHLIDEP